MTTNPTTNTRTWNVALVIEGKAIPVDVTDVPDLQADVIAAACNAAEGVRDFFVDAITYKTTKAHGAFVPDRCYRIRYSGRARRLVAEQTYGTGHSTPNPFTA